MQEEAAGGDLCDREESAEARHAAQMPQGRRRGKAAEQAPSPPQGLRHSHIEGRRRAPPPPPARRSRVAGRADSGEARAGWGALPRGASSTIIPTAFRSDSLAISLSMLS